MLKELLANAFDACEEAEIAPENHPGRRRRDHHHRQWPRHPGGNGYRAGQPRPPLYRGAAAGPGGVRALEGEETGGKVLFEVDEGLGGGGHGGGSWPEIRSDGPYVVPKPRNTPLIE